MAVTKADVEEALSLPVGVGQDETNGVRSTCDYAARGGQVTVTLQRIPAKLNLTAEIESLVKTIPQSSVRNAAGIGTRAFFLDIPGAGTQLHVIRGDHDYLLVSVLGFGDAAQVSAAAETMARRALARL